MKISFFILCFILAASISSAQYVNDTTRWFYFTDKNDNGYSISQPEDFLSQKSIDRRAWQNLGIDQTDLPVTRSYIDSIKKTGVQVVHVSKWLNGILVSTHETRLFDSISKISFIDTQAWESETDDIYFPPTPSGIRFDPPYSTPPAYSYGISGEQLEQLGLHSLHEKGYSGKGVLIAVLDAGFYKLNELSGMSYAFNNDRILETCDFVGFSEDVYIGHTHGTYVSSIIAANLADSVMGAAPDVSLLLARTENPESESKIEEYAWIAGAEWADSIGADILNTSLGYTTFDDSTTNYRYEDMDGRTAAISIANSMTATKGIISVTSAGNSGNDPWYYLGAPADATNILSVGAVNTVGELAAFSSRGPSADYRIKPEVSATGSNTALQAINGSLAYGSGTSFSAPLISGATAILWQAYPSLQAKELMDWIIKSADRYHDPDIEYGFGIPSYIGAYYSITAVDHFNQNNKISIYPNPFTSFIQVDMPDSEPGNFRIRLFDIQGRLVYDKVAALPGRLHFHEAQPSGLYIIEISSSTETFRSRIIKN